MKEARRRTTFPSSTSDTSFPNASVTSSATSRRIGSRTVCVTRIVPSALKSHTTAEHSETLTIIPCRWRHFVTIFFLSFAAHFLNKANSHVRHTRDGFEVQREVGAFNEKRAFRVRANANLNSPRSFILIHLRKQIKVFTEHQCSASRQLRKNLRLSGNTTRCSARCLPQTLFCLQNATHCFNSIEF